MALSRRWPRWVLVAPCLVLLAAAQGVRGQDACVPEGAEPNDALITPSPNTPEAVTLDAPVIARFAAGTNVLDADPVGLLALWRVEEQDGEEVEVPIEGTYERFVAQPNVLVFRPQGGLSPRTRYVGDAVDPSGLEPRELSFGTGDRQDEVVPRMRARVARLGSRETGAQCGAVRVDVVFAPAQDDGPVGSVEHLVFQTRGAGLAAPVLRQRVRAAMASEVSASFLLTDQEAAKPICVAVLPVDGTGRVGTGTEPECFTPSSRTSFVGLCTPRPSSRTGAVWGFGVLAIAIVWTRRRCST